MVQNIGDVTSDESDNVFVCNNTDPCLQMFSADGVCIEDVVRNDEEYFARPTLVLWNKIRFVITCPKIDTFI